MITLACSIDVCENHSVQWNFTGWIVGWHKSTGQLVERFATEGGKLLCQKREMTVTGA